MCSVEFLVHNYRVENGRKPFCSMKCRDESYREPEPIRFARYVNKTESCHIWTGYKDKAGYGKFQFKKPDGKFGTRAARYALGQHLGYTIPDDVLVRHVCPGGPNTSCVNPLHLKLGNASDNMQDAIKEGTFPMGENHTWSKLTKSQAEEVLFLYFVKKWTLQRIAALRGVTRQAIWMIVHGINWKQLPGRPTSK